MSDCNKPYDEYDKLRREEFEAECHDEDETWVNEYALTIRALEREYFRSVL